MLNGLRHWLAVGRMQRRRRKTLKAFRKEIAGAKKAGLSSREITNLRGDEHEEVTFIDDEIGIAESQRLCQQAARYRVPVPQTPESWEDSTPFGTRFLSRVGASKLRADLRAEQEARWDYWQARITLMGSIMGIVGGIMGAIAFFKPH